MTKEEKDLLLKDLCARLPYKVKVQDTYYKSLEPNPIWLLDLHAQKVRLFADEGYQSIEYIKPYLFPLSSMSEWQDRELEILMKNSIESCGMLSPYDCLEMERFFNENHLDWRGLIPMGLAIDATGLDIYRNYGNSN